MPNQIPASWLLGNQSLPGVGGQQGMNPQMMQLLSYIMASRMEGGEGQQPPQSTEQPINPYIAQQFRPMPTNLSPLGRFNDMALRQSAALATRMQDGKDAVNEGTERQRLVDSISHPPPLTPYSISRPSIGVSTDGSGPPTDYGNAPAYLQSKYGTGGVSFAPPGTKVHGTFGPDHLPFGQIGGPNEALPIGKDPWQETYQQQMIMDHDKADAVAKALGKRKKS